MRPNPILRKLGFGGDDRVVIVHADDVGMCQATVPAFFELMEGGLVSSGSAMVPCPWFREAASWARRTPDTDLGVHLTLTSEWDNYRWGPVANRDPGSGMIDTDGCFYRSPASMRHPDTDACAAEMRAQVRMARDAGIDVTHIDSHMFVILANNLAERYVGLGFELGLPVLLTRQPAWVDILTPAALDRWEDRGMPVFDHLREIPSIQDADTLRPAVAAIFDALPPGLTYMLMHPAHDSPELRAIGEDLGHRVAEYQVFRDPALCDHGRTAGIHVIGWRPIRDLMRGKG